MPAALPAVLALVIRAGLKEPEKWQQMKAQAEHVGTQLFFDTIVEVDMSGKVVWEWSFWDHAIQSVDATKANYVATGKTIAEPLSQSKVFPPMVISMIAVGEQTGGLDEMLTKIADFYDEEVDVAVGALLSLMEPVMIVVLGVVVGGMVVAMYLPIFDMMNAIQ